MTPEFIGDKYLMSKDAAAIVRNNTVDGAMKAVR
jgi:hypothetical protein